uniref:Uncharacterized protein n=1 Tax=Acrobeloides nanus TaxID=290746 RepID=A0A914D6R8_9BILA
MTIDTNLANWNKENECSAKSVRFAESKAANLYKSSRSRSTSSSPTIKSQQKSPRCRVESDSEVPSDSKWKKIREKFATEEDIQNEDELVNELLKLCEWWTLPEYTEDFNPSADSEDEWFERHLSRTTKRKSPYRSRAFTITSSNNSSTSSLEGLVTSCPQASQANLSLGLSSLRLNSKVFTDPDWIERDEDSQLSTDSGYKSETPTLNPNPIRKPFGLRQETVASNPIKQPSFGENDFAWAEETTPKVEEAQKKNLKPLSTRKNSQEFWNDIHSVNF